MAKKTKNVDSINAENEESQYSIVSIYLNVGGRTICKTINAKNNKELEKSIHNLTRNVKFAGSVLVRLIMNGNPADEATFNRVAEILKKK